MGNFCTFGTEFSDRLNAFFFLLRTKMRRPITPSLITSLFDWQPLGHTDAQTVKPATHKPLWAGPHIRLVCRWL